MAYVYRHIRLDKNEPFYIGIGGDDNYKRANTKLGRNKFWKNVTSVSDFTVDILVDNVSWDEACIKECEFISIYKRRKDGGTLCNLTLGGEGQKGMTPWNLGKKTPEETRKKQSLKRMGKTSPIKGTKRPQHVIDACVKANLGRTPWNKGVKMSESAKAKRAVSMQGKYKTGEAHHQYGKPIPIKVLEALRLANIDREPFNKGKKMTEQHYKNYLLASIKKYKPVLKFSIDGVFIEEYNSIAAAAKYLGITRGCLFRYVKSGCTPYKGHVWKYKMPN